MANYKHRVSVYKLDCTGSDARKKLCASFGHGAIHEYEEPPLMFLHAGEWSESYHDDIQQKKVPKPSNRRQRVASVIRWLDAAAPRAQTTLIDRSNMMARMQAEGSPMQRYMRQQAKENEKKQKEGEKEGEKPKPEL